MTHLLIETSGRGGLIGLVRGDVVVQSASLDEARRHVCDLADNVRRLCGAEAMAPRAFASVVISIGPGSYTGLRVGLASAKALAYAAGCDLIAVPTFLAIVEGVPTSAAEVDIAADALNGTIYVQRFDSSDGDWRPTHDLRIVEKNSQSFAAIVEMDRRPTLAGLWAASRKIEPLSKEELFALEPLYLRGSSAEEKRKLSRT